VSSGISSPNLDLKVSRRAWFRRLVSAPKYPSGARQRAILPMSIAAAPRCQFASDRATDASGGAGKENASTFESHAQNPTSLRSGYDAECTPELTAP
jgi:hypothetical protein